MRVSVQWSPYAGEGRGSIVCVVSVVSSVRGVYGSLSIGRSVYDARPRSLLVKAVEWRLARLTYIGVRDADGNTDQSGEPQFRSPDSS